MSEKERLQQEVDDVVRRSMNKTFVEGGIEAVKDRELRMRTCGGCGYETEDKVKAMICPICGRTIIDDLDAFLDGNR